MTASNRRVEAVRRNFISKAPTLGCARDIRRQA
jgi:hypothetical protein